MSVLFLGSGPFGRPALVRLARLEPRLAVATVPDAPRGRSSRLRRTVIKLQAEELGLPCHEVATLKGDAGARLLSETGASLVIVADFRLILPRSFLEAPARHCYNLHGSVLPRWRGAAPVSRGVLAGDRSFGVTLYQMVKKLDAGPVVDHFEYRPEPGARASEIEEVLCHRAADLLEKWWAHLCSGEVPLEPQDETRVTLAPRHTKEEGWIPWEDAPEAIQNRILALDRWPRTFTRWVPSDPDSGVLVCVDEARPEAPGEPLPPGTVRRLSSAGIEVACGLGGRSTIVLLTVQRSGKRSMRADEFLRGCPLKPGDRLVSETPNRARP